MMKRDVVTNRGKSPKMVDAADKKDQRHGVYSKQPADNAAVIAMREIMDGKRPKAR